VPWAVNYYNEHDKKKAAWLRELIKANIIAPGEVDERSVEDVRPDELVGFTQCHFFAGIGIWSYALRLAGWPDDKQVWTGSCPCQPFSSAGKRAGFNDPRHLWPAWFHLIAQCGPSVIFGEQVAKKDGLAWLDNVFDDLEGQHYAAAPFNFVAERMGDTSGAGLPVCELEAIPRTRGRPKRGAAEQSSCALGRMGNTSGQPFEWRTGGVSGKEKKCAGSRNSDGRLDHGHSDASEIGGLADADGGNASPERQQRGGKQRQQPQDGCASERLADSASNGRRQGTENDSGSGSGNNQEGISTRFKSSGDGSRPGPTNGFWNSNDWLGCRDGKWRPVEPGTFPLANGTPARVLRLRGYGDGINAEVAKEFIKAYMGHVI
jgi:hypothetical protein